MPDRWATIFEHTTQRLYDQDMPAEWYVLPGYTGYAGLTNTPVDVYCLEALLGVSHQRPDHKTYALLQAFDPRYPHLGLVAMVERRDSDGAPNTTTQPVYNHAIDKRFSYTFLPAAHVALNPLDPTNQNKSLLVQSYHARITLGDLPQATVATVRLMSRFKADGQLAQIAVDFDDPLTVFIARLVGPLAANRNVHYLPRRAQLSALQIPIRNPASDQPYLIGNNSTTLDEGFAIAYRYLDQHAKASVNSIQGEK